MTEAMWGVWGKRKRRKAVLVDDHAERLADAARRLHEAQRLGAWLRRQPPPIHAWQNANLRALPLADLDWLTYVEPFVVSTTMQAPHQVGRYPTTIEAGLPVPIETMIALAAREGWADMPDQNDAYALRVWWRARGGSEILLRRRR